MAETPSNRQQNLKSGGVPGVCRWPEANGTILGMKKPTNVVTTLLLSGALCAPAGFAQQTQTPAAQAPAAGSSTAQTTAPASKPTNPTKDATSAQGGSAAKTGASAGTKKPGTSSTLATNKQKASYALGQNIGHGMKKDDLDVDLASLMRGIREAMAGTKPALSELEQRAALTKLATDVRAKQQAKYEAESTKNKSEGEAFLTTNKVKQGVVALPSGLQYKILKEGAGPKPAATDSVSCNYRGTLVNGKEFDSSAKHGGQPVTFGVNQVIRGWTEALQLMPVGSKWQLYVPADLAYGPRGQGSDIGPNSTLIFDVELVSIAAKPEPAKPADPAKPLTP